MSQAEIVLPTRHDRSASGRTRAIVSCAIGNAFELFDFVLYGFFAVPISRAFFPAGNDAAALISTFLTFGVGFLFRPLGAAILGRYGDRHGRRPALVVTIGIMALATGGIGLLPTYTSLGLLAPALLLLCRCAQGFSTGGEWGAAATYLVECARSGKRGLAGAWQQTGAQAGATVAALAAYLVTHNLAASPLLTWGWRLPFLFGLLLGPIGYYLRASGLETPVFETCAQRARNPLAEVIVRHGVMLARGVLIPATGIAVYAVMLVTMPAYAQTTLHMDAGSALLSTTLASMLILALTPLTGAASDRIGRRRMLGAAAALFALGAYPLFALATVGTFKTLLAAQLIAAAVQALNTGCIAAQLAEMFPTQIRQTAISLSYGFSVMIFGGFSPFAAAWLLHATSNPRAPAFIVMAAAILSLIAILTLQEPVDVRHERGV